MAKTVCIVTSLHPDYDARVYKHCLSVRRLGYRTVLISFWQQRPMNDGIEHLQFPFCPGKKGRLRHMRHIWRLMKQADADCYHFHDLDIIPMMMAWRVLHRRPVVYDIHENYSEEMMYRYALPHYQKLMLRESVRLTERMGIRLFGNVVIVADSQRPAVEGRARNIVMIRNFASLELLKSVREDQASRPPTVILNASAYAANGLHLFLDVAERTLGVRTDVSFRLVDRFGPYDNERQVVLDRLARPPLAGYVSMLPNVLPDRIMDNINQATIGAAFDLRVPSRVKAIPTKLFEYMAAGLPIVATDLPNSAHYVNAFECGLLGRPEDPQSLVDRICYLVDQPQQATEMGRKGRQAFERELNWESQDAAYASFYATVLHHGRA